MQYLVIAGLLVFLASVYYAFVYVRYHKENRKIYVAQRREFGRDEIVDGALGLLEAMGLSIAFIAILMDTNAASTAADNVKELFAAVLICAKSGYSYKESLLSAVDLRSDS